MQQKLSDLDLYATGHITALNCRDSVRRRLLDLGFVPGAEVTPLLGACHNSIRAYAVGGRVISMRQITADDILVRSK